MRTLIFATMLLLTSIVASCQSKHTVDIQIAASPDSDVTQYKVYRATVANDPAAAVVCTVPVSVLIPPPPLGCNDAAVINGNTYFYRATAVSSRGESAPTAEAKAVIPQATAPPGAITITVK